GKGAGDHPPRARAGLTDKPASRPARVLRARGRHRLLRGAQGFGAGQAARGRALVRELFAGGSKEPICGARACAPGSFGWRAGGGASAAAGRAGTPGGRRGVGRWTAGGARDHGDPDLGDALGRAHGLRRRHGGRPGGVHGDGQGHGVAGRAQASGPPGPALSARNRSRDPIPGARSSAPDSLRAALDEGAVNALVLLLLLGGEGDFWTRTLARSPEVERWLLEGDQRLQMRGEEHLREAEAAFAEAVRL